MCDVLLKKVKKYPHTPLDVFVLHQYLSIELKYGNINRKQRYTISLLLKQVHSKIQKAILLPTICTSNCFTKFLQKSNLIATS